VDLLREHNIDAEVTTVHLLTHIRVLGFVFNPVSFYYCSGPGGELVAIVAEITNTPWGERHCEVLDVRKSVGDGRLQRFEFDKTFHVSPFMPMEQRYEWAFTPPGESLAVQMESYEAGRLKFDATLTMRRGALSRASILYCLARYPFETIAVVVRIYWNALRLWLKGAPFCPHPAAKEHKEALTDHGRIDRPPA
jgi:DUF1365 family protein